MVFLVLCVGASICFASEIDKAKAEIAGLESEKASIENTWLRAMNEFMEVQQDAAAVMQKAKEIAKQKTDYTCEEKNTIYLAAYYTQYLEKLYAIMLFLEYRMENVEEKLIDAKKRLSGLREA